MIRSMTGFASLERSFPFGRLIWELRSVNHRYLEYHIRLPEEFRVLEPKVREVISSVISRGKVDATLRFHESPSHTGGSVELNDVLARRLLELHARLGELANTSQSPDISALLRWPGLVEEQLADAEPMHKAALDMLETACASLHAGRGREGEQMATAIRERLQGVDHWTRQVRGWLPDIRQALQQKMRDRVEELGQNLDEDRLVQEVSVLAQKMDVAEELDRLDAHVLEAHRALDLDKPVGRRLDFLMQEFNRESNTLSSKSVDERTTKAAVELKVLIEQMREQVQNVE